MMIMSTIAQVKHQVDRIWYASFQTDLADTLAAHLRRHALAGVQAALEMALVEELKVHRQPYRQQYLPVALQRSGSYTRRVLTTHGFIPDLHVPKLRSQSRAALAGAHPLSAVDATPAGSGPLSLHPRPLDPRSARGAV